MSQTDSVICVAIFFHELQMMEALFSTNEGQIRVEINKLDGLGPMDNRPSPN